MQIPLLRRESIDQGGPRPFYGHLLYNLVAYLWHISRTKPVAILAPTVGEIDLIMRVYGRAICALELVISDQRTQMTVFLEAAERG